MSEEKEQQARIEEFIKGNVPVKLPKGKLGVLVATWVIFFIIGIFALIDLVGPHSIYVVAWLSALIVAELWLPIIILIVIAGGVIILTVWAMIRLLRNHGYGLLKFSIILSTVMAWVFVIIAFIIIPWTPELLFMLIMPIFSTILTILYFTIWKARLELAGGILTITGQVTHEEKHLMVPGFLKVFFVGALGTFGLIIGLDIIAYTVPALNPLWFHYIPALIYAFGLFLYIYINTYFFNAIVHAVVYIWYRKKDPTFHDGLAIATYQLPDIALYATFSAIVRFIRMLLRAAASRSKTKPAWVGGGFRLADGIIGTVWFYVNYFTLPSIVIEDVPTTTAIKRSAHRLFDNWVDVLLKEWGVSSVFNVLQFLIILLFAFGGGLLGFVLWLIYPTIDIVLLIVLGVIIFLLISTLVSRPLLGLFNDIYMTFLFGFVIDKETNFKYENNLPKELNEKLRDWFKSHPAVQRCQKCFAKVPEGASSCPKCNAPYP